MPTLSALPDDPFRRLVVSIFRINGALLAAGDRLVEDLGLTSARWQVLGTAVDAPVSLTVAHIARNMGLTRQTVRTTVRELEASNFVRLELNPHHQRAQLVVPTGAGKRAYAAAAERQAEWAKEITAAIDGSEMTASAEVLQRILAQLLCASPLDDD